MKRIVALSFLFIATYLQFGFVYSQAVGKGNLIIDPYYGFPNFRKYYANTVGDLLVNSDVSTMTNQKASSFGPVGLRVEYLLADRFGLGFDFIYTNFRNEFTTTEQVYNEQTNTFDVVSNFNTFRMNRIRFQVRINYHFEVNDPDLDVYIGLGAGSNNKFTKRTINGIENDFEFDGIVAIPMSLRFCSGVRYYFNENIGFNLEIGLGGPLLSGGISFKI